MLPALHSLTIKQLHWVASLSLLAGCAVNIPKPTPQELAPAATEWNSPLQSSASVQNSWASWQDASLNTLLAHTLASHPNIAQAKAKINEARAEAAAIGAHLWPNISATAGYSRGMNSLPNAESAKNLANAGLDARWELDLWGGIAAARQGVYANLSSNENAYEQAAASLAAELANTLTAYRACKGQEAISAQILESHILSARLMHSKLDVGLASLVDAAKSDHEQAEARFQASDIATQCGVTLKALVAITGLQEDALKTMLAPEAGMMPGRPALAVKSIPAEVLADRPDIKSAALLLETAAAEVAVKEVARYPSASLLGMICVGCQLSEGINLDSRNWSFGISLNIPVFNAGELSAKQDAAMARYQQAIHSYQQLARQAVREIEENMLRLDDSQRRTQVLQQQLSLARVQLKASQALYKAGSASQLQTAETERYELAAQSRLLTLQREQSANWIALYKALGGKAPNNAEQKDQQAQSAVITKSTQNNR
ncbi:efflux transporter outer membrane subunit [Iodobacter sp. HSC-16F04]|uniref:Efflux transporter outer membrane subunit n=1 Tax=Iodobacter violaceini TaxID=3044271 RepID=A0ABX0KKZ3_9NEIS|nr:efflux transporter outer membrane subunit [Iodobacter violacea]NHQ84773.1 efflux transporter outer membrane subunit [Iodobacter violacea]